MHQSYGPERLGSVAQEGKDVGFLLVEWLFQLVVFGIFFRVPLLNLQCGVDNAEYKYGCAHVEGPNNRVGDDTCGGNVADADEGEEEGEDKAHH